MRNTYIIFPNIFLSNAQNPSNMSACYVRHEYSALVAPDLDSLVVTPAHDKMSFCISTLTPIRCCLRTGVSNMNLFSLSDLQMPEVAYQWLRLCFGQ